MKKRIVITEPESEKNYQRFVNLKDEYDLYVDRAVTKIYGSTVIADTGYDIWPLLEIYYDGTMAEFEKIKKGTAFYKEEEDHYGSYYHNVSDSTVWKRVYDKWVYGYDEIVVHCSDGDHRYCPIWDEDNEAVTLDHPN